MEISTIQLSMMSVSSYKVWMLEDTNTLLSPTFITLASIACYITHTIL